MRSTSLSLTGQDRKEERWQSPWRPPSSEDTNMLHVGTQMLHYLLLIVTLPEKAKPEHKIGKLEIY